MNMRCGILVLLLFWYVSSAHGQGHGEAVVPKGARVLVTVSSLPSPFLGTLEGVSTESLLWRVEPGDTLATWPLRGVAKLEVSHGQRPNTWRGALIGALAGAGAGALVGLAAGSDECPEGGLAGLAAAGCLTRGEAAAGGALLGVVGGGVIGLLIGSASRSERRRSVSPQRLRVALGYGCPGRVAAAGAVGI